MSPRACTVTHGLEHLLTRNDELQPGRPSLRAAAAARVPCVQGQSLPPKPEPRNFTNDPHVLARYIEDRADDVAMVGDRLRRFIERERLAVVDCASDACSSLGRAFGLGYVGAIDFDGRSIVGSFGVATPAGLGWLCSSPTSSSSTLGVATSAYVISMSAPAAVASSNVSATTNATYCPVIADDVVGKRRPCLVDCAGIRRGS